LIQQGCSSREPARKTIMFCIGAVGPEGRDLGGCATGAILDLVHRPSILFVLLACSAMLHTKRGKLGGGHLRDPNARLGEAHDLEGATAERASCSGGRKPRAAATAALAFHMHSRPVYDLWNGETVCVSIQQDQ